MCPKRVSKRYAVTREDRQLDPRKSSILSRGIKVRPIPCLVDGKWKYRLDLEKSNDKTIIQRVGLTSITTTDWDIDEEETKHIFYEAFSGRLFESTAHKVLQAELAVANNMADGGFVSINDFYEFLGLERLEGLDSIGWCICDGYQWVEFNHYKTLLEVASDGSDIQQLEALVIDYQWLPETESYLLNEL